MKVKTTRFGTLDVAEKDLMVFPEGLVGFAGNKRFVIYSKENNHPFFWLQSADDPKLAFVICDPAMFFPDYRISARKSELSTIGSTNPEDLIICVLVSISREPFTMSANLQGPLVINTKNRRGKQLVLVESNYGTRHPIPLKQETMGVPHPLLAQRARNSSSVENCLVLT
ncbi:MAG: flagellar assembly protein FliW [Candidatus Glassbacteria bacterium]|nr:flagellar assembly protein FliW [Candidatus Glassbacteria bacterium]